MKIRQAVFLVAFLGLLFAVAGCYDDQPRSTQTLEVTTQPVSGSNLRLLSITSTEYWLEDKQNEVRSKLESTVNGGGFNIISVKTLYSFGYLTAAEVTYDTSGCGDGNSIRVIFISQSDKYYVKSRLDTAVNSGKYDIVKINTIYAQDGYLRAAEVFYREKR